MPEVEEWLPSCTAGHARILNTGDTRRARRPLYDVLRSQVFFGLPRLVLVLSLVYVMVYRLRKPIERITVAVQEAGKGDLDTQVTGVRTGDELDDLARVFNLVIRRSRVCICKSAASRDVREPLERKGN